MKKTLAVVALLATALTMATAKGAPVLWVHGFAGYSLGSTWGDGTGADNDNYTYSMPFGDNLDFGGGVALNFALASIFGLSVGADFSYNQIGVTATAKSDTQYYGQSRFSYMAIDIPVMITARYNKFNFALGPNFSIPLSGTAYSKTNLPVVGETSTTSDKFEFTTPFIVGLNFAAGYEQRIGMMRGVIGVRYLLDFMPLKGKATYSVGSISTTGDEAVVGTRRALNVDVGVKVPLKF